MHHQSNATSHERTELDDVQRLAYMETTMQWSGMQDMAVSWPRHRFAKRCGGEVYLLISWNSPMQRFISARQAASSYVQESGGKPPLLSPRLIAPLVG